MRIRSIKPEFWRSDDIDALIIEDRLLFIGLWSYVDDSGVGIDKEAAIAADLFAGDLSRDPHECSVRVHGGLKRLSDAGLITRYAVGGRRFLHITNWSKHQKINRPTPSRYPDPTCGDAGPPEGLSEAAVSPLAKSAVGTGEQGNRGTGEGTTAPAADAAEDDLFDKFWAEYPRKVDKQDARKAWKSVLRQKKADPIRLIAAARSYAAQRTGQDPKFTKHAATWLNKGAYDNEPEQPALQLVSGGYQPYRNPTDPSVWDEPLLPPNAQEVP